MRDENRKQDREDNTKKKGYLYVLIAWKVKRDPPFILITQSLKIVELQSINEGRDQDQRVNT